MKKLISIIFLSIPLSVLISSCSSIGDKTVSLSIIYAIVAVVSLVILIGYCIRCKSELKKQLWLILLFTSVVTVNCGYFWLSCSKVLSQALWANRISYLGSVFLPLSMLMIILGVTNTAYKQRLPVCLFILSGIMFLIVASPGILDIYYKEVSLSIENGVTSLDKVYGPLHILYLFYLLGYFGAMVTFIIRAAVKKAPDSTAHATLLAIAVFVNIGVWFIEQIADFDFEMLSVSYIISELFLLGVYQLAKENQRLKNLVMNAPTLSATKKNTQGTVNTEALRLFFDGIDTLTVTERRIFDAYIMRATTKEIMQELCITENTLKFHNKNIYSKLGVRSRKELLEIYKQSNK